MNWDISDNSQNIRYGGFLRRTFAFLIDLVIIKMLNFALIGSGLVASWKAMNDLELSAPSEDLVYLLIGLFSLTGIILFFSYFYYFNVKGQTPGKRILGLKIVSRSGVSPRPPQALTRSFGLFFSCLFFPGFLLILFTKEKRALHDLLAGTYVVHT